MSNLLDYNWFVKNIIPLLKDKSLSVLLRNFKDGDFGDLNQIVVSSGISEGIVDFWTDGVISVELYDMVKDNPIFETKMFFTEERVNALPILKDFIKYFLPDFKFED